MTDILSELEKQVGPLAKQSETAREYLKLKEELKRYEVNLFLTETHELKVQLREVESKEQIVTGDLEETQKTSEQIRVTYEELDQQLLSPLHEIIFTARAINNGSINHIIDSDAPQGLDSITRAFQSMQYNLNNSIQQHENVEKRKQILYAGIAHDLRTPLTSIIGYYEALNAGIANTPEKKRRYIQAISTQADVLLHLVDQLSIYNKLSARKATFPLYKVNLESLIRSYLNIEGDSLLTKHVHVKTKLKSNIYVMANTDEFQRILTNFFTNSIKYRKLPESNVVISLCRNPDDDEEAILSYHDDGPGVEESKLEKIFEPFYRTSEARTKTSNGSGLGLAVVAEIVSIHKGRIQALNDNGLLIKIYLPILKSKEIIK